MKRLSVGILFLLGLSLSSSTAIAQELEPDLPPNSTTLGNEPVKIEPSSLSPIQFPPQLNTVSLQDGIYYETNPVFGGVQYEVTLEEVTLEDENWSHGVFLDENYLQQDIQDRNGVFIKNKF
ncbi:MAG: hypothetical protein WA865_09475 [Spirulinaceae cyanobacterium]